jgi:hypothetical protein
MRKWAILNFATRIRDSFFIGSSIFACKIEE